MINGEFKKIQIARSFSRAANSYNQANFLQNEVGEQLCHWLKEGDNNPLKIIDLGSGTGIITAKLADIFPHAKVLGIDIAENMVRHAERYFSIKNNLSFLCADADHLPLEDASIDFVFSNLMLQWSSSLSVTLLEIHRILKPRGRFIFSTLGPKSLSELRNSWQAVDDNVHINSFVSREQLMVELSRTQLINYKFITRCHTRLFTTIYDLMRELKTLGAHNLNERRHKGLSGKKKFDQLQVNYEQYRYNNKLPVSYEVYYGYTIK